MWVVVLSRVFVWSLVFTITTFGNWPLLVWTTLLYFKRGCTQKCHAVMVGLLYSLSFSVFTIWCAAFYIILSCIIHRVTALWLHTDAWHGPYSLGINSALFDDGRLATVTTKLLFIKMSQPFWETYMSCPSDFLCKGKCLLDLCSGWWSSVLSASWQALALVAAPS